MNTLRKIVGLVALSIMVLFALSLSSPRAMAQQAALSQDYPHSYYFSFDTTVAPWVPVFNGQTKQPGLNLDRSPDGNGCAPAHEGRGYASLSMFNVESTVTGKGRDSDRPLPVRTWIVAAFPANGANTVSIDYYAAMAKGCEGCLPVVYAGAKNPNSWDFTTDSNPLSSKWQPYSYKTSVVANGKLFVAIGFNGYNGYMSLDCIHITIDSIAQQKDGNTQ
jgi:hypothetical protein